MTTEQAAEIITLLKSINITGWVVLAIVAGIFGASFPRRG